MASDDPIDELTARVREDLRIADLCHNDFTVKNEDMGRLLAVVERLRERASSYGIAVVVGDIPIVEDRKKVTFRYAILVQFASEEECKEAIERRGMTFGLFDDERTEGGEAR